ncbi:3903_t:CDS:2 [Scutellospora calospora]|uniref:3903_t:CDS:1 n=1 Tax=Scutellospora calospora TaxID=85575 RepID=A0ACA9JU29_9GLOM|nr:3903_t:CDS:2 [Scutellospora calospora]
MEDTTKVIQEIAQELKSEQESLPKKRRRATTTSEKLSKEIKPMSIRKRSSSRSSTSGSKTTSGEPWNAQEDKILIENMLRLIPSVPWAEFAKKFPNRNVKSLQNRWQYLKKRLHG